MSDRRAEYSREYQAAAEQPYYAPARLSAMAPMQRYGGGQYGEPSVGVGAADPYSVTRKRCASDSDGCGAGRE